MDETPAEVRVGRLEGLVGDLAARNEDLLARNDDLVARVDALEAERAARPVRPDLGIVPSAAAGVDERTDERRPAAGADAPEVSRRHLLRTSGGVAAAGLGLALAGEALRPKPASAAAGQPLILGRYNDADASSTRVTTVGDYGFYATAGSFGTGVYGLGGVLGVQGQSLYGRGGSFFGGLAQLGLQVDGSRPPTEDTSEHLAGDVVVDKNADMWLCTAGGTPGTFRKLAGPGTAGALHLFPAPIRVYDSRPGTQPPTGPKTKLVANTPRIIQAIGNSAMAVLVTCLLVNAAPGNGNFTIWSFGVPRPASNTLVWGGSAGRFSTTAVTAVGGGYCQVQANLSTDFVLDVVGFYL